MLKSQCGNEFYCTKVVVVQTESWCDIVFKKKNLFYCSVVKVPVSQPASPRTQSVPPTSSAWPAKAGKSSLAPVEVAWAWWTRRPVRCSRSLPGTRGRCAPCWSCPGRWGCLCAEVPIVDQGEQTSANWRASGSPTYGE